MTQCAFCRTAFIPTKYQKYTIRKCCSSKCGAKLARPLMKGKTPWNKGKHTEVPKNWGIETRFRKGHRGLWFGIKGEGTPNWKGGTTPLTKSIRTSLEYRNWRKKVFERDNYTCTICDIRGVEIHADHIKRFSEYLELRFEI